MTDHSLGHGDVRWPTSAAADGSCNRFDESSCLSNFEWCISGDTPAFFVATRQPGGRPSARNDSGLHVGEWWHFAAPGPKAAWEGLKASAPSGHWLGRWGLLAKTSEPREWAQRDIIVEGASASCTERPCFAQFLQRGPSSSDGLKSEEEGAFRESERVHTHMNICIYIYIHTHIFCKYK